MTDGDLEGRRGRAPRRSSAPRPATPRASAAAYAVRAGHDAARCSCPQGKIALGKLAQALVHGAQVLQVRRQLRRLPRAGPQAGRRLPGRAGQLGQPDPHRGAEDRRVRGRATCSAARPTCTACRSATPATSPPTGRATASTPATASSPARRGCSASRPPAPRRSCTARRSRARRPSRPRSGSATRPRGTLAVAARDESGGLIDAVTDEQILGRLPAAGRAARGCSSSRPRRPASPGCSQTPRTARLPAGRRSCAPSPATG